MAGKAPGAQIDEGVITETLDLDKEMFEIFWRATFKWVIQGEEPDFEKIPNGSLMRMAFKMVKRGVEKGRGQYEANGNTYAKGGLKKAWNTAKLGTEADFERLWLLHDGDPEEMKKAMKRFKPGDSTGELVGKEL